jgi:predicted MFS family arabinose efflux permease
LIGIEALATYGSDMWLTRRRIAVGPSWGWYVVGACFCIAVFGWGLGFYGPGFYLLELRARHSWTTSEISAAATAYFLYGAGLIMVLPAALHRWGSRATVMTGICAMAASVAVIPSAGHLWQLYAIYLVMAIGWATMSSTAIAAVLAPWFTRRRGLALSLALNGASVGGIVMVPAMVWLAGRWGFAGATRTVAVASLVVLIPLGWVVVGRGEPERVTGTAVAGAPGRFAGLTEPSFWRIAAPFALALTAQVGFLNQQLSILAPWLGAGRAALAVSVTAAAALAGRVGLGLSADHVNLRAAAVVVFGIQAVALVALFLWGSAGVLAAYLACAVFGLSVGNVITLPALLVHQEFPQAAFTQVVSLSTAVGQVTYAFGPALLALIRDTAGDYRPALAACIALEVAAAAMVGPWRGQVLADAAG